MGRGRQGELPLHNPGPQGPPRIGACRLPFPRSGSPFQSGQFHEDMIPTVGFSTKITKGNVTSRCARAGRQWAERSRAPTRRSPGRGLGAWGPGTGSRARERGRRAGGAADARLSSSGTSGRPRFRSMWERYCMVSAIV